MIKIKRVYEPAARDDGTRVLVDRVWPRGVTKDGARVVQWMRELGPSDALRKFFNHDPARWNEFRKRYRRELRSADAREKLSHLAAMARKHRLTLVYGARDEIHNQAAVLQEVLQQMMGTASSKAQNRGRSRSSKEPE
jgi:uncharacterized protein YeaO (DUF488 family)